MYNIADKIDDKIYENTHMFLNNLPTFSPEKEMIFIHKDDINNEKDFSLFIHGDGSLTFKKKDIVIDIANYTIFENLSKGQLKKLLEFKKSKTLNENNSFIKTFNQYFNI